MGCVIRIVICTKPAAKSMRTTTELRKGEGRAGAADAPAAGFVRGGSLIKKTSSTVMIVRPAAAIIKVDRMLKASARMPPTRGPSTPPAVMPACMMPRQKPSFFCGALALMMASVAGHKPAERPCTMRTAKSCQGVSTMPPKKYVMARQNEARMAMSFLDFLSARAPQIGAQMPEIRKVTEKIVLLHQLTSACATPSSLIRYIGRNGTSIV